MCCETDIFHDRFGTRNFLLPLNGPEVILRWTVVTPSDGQYSGRIFHAGTTRLGGAPSLLVAWLVWIASTYCLASLVKTPTVRKLMRWYGMQRCPEGLTP